MKIINKLLTLPLIILSGIVLFSACDDDDEKMEKVRLFRPSQFTSSVSGTTVTLEWVSIKDAIGYNLELHQDSLQFENLVVSEQNITNNRIEIPDLIGGTRYSARVTALADDSQYNSRPMTLTFVTQSENIFFPIEANDIAATSVTLRWGSGLNVSHIVIGNQTVELTDADVNAGFVTIEGLTGSTSYTAQIFNGEILRGTRSFITQIDLDGAIAVYPEDNLITVINEAEDGDVLALFPGFYLENSGSVTIDKNLTIVAVNAADKPTVFIRFVLDGDTNINFNVENIKMSGFTVEEGEVTTTRQTYVFDLTGNAAFNNVSMYGVEIKNFQRSLLRATSGAGSIQHFSIDNCIIDAVCDGNNDFIDIRSGFVHQISITRSTISNSSTSRDFLRSDVVAGLSGQNILINQCTFYQVSTPANRFLYVRSTESASTVTNNIFANMGEREEAAQVAESLTLTNNNYHNSEKLAEFEPGALAIDPEFENPTNLNFTIPFSNQLRTMGPNGGILGDPRWAID